MRLVLLNPNTTESMTDLILNEVRKTAQPTTELVAVTARFGCRYVATRTSYAIAGHAVLDAYAEHGRDADAVLLACFGDPALFALKELARQPVIGMAEASCLAAAALGGRFAIVTGGERWGPMLREFVTSLGMIERLAHVETVAPTGADIARDPDGSLSLLADACCRCVEKYGADSVILGGAGLAGIAARIADRVPVPLVDSFAVSVRMAEQLAASWPGKSHVGSFATPPPVDTIGLAAPLAKLVEGH